MCRSCEIWGAIDPKLKTKKRVLGATPHAKYGKDRINGVGGANTQFVTSSGLPFVCVFLYSLPSVWVAPLDRSRQLMAHNDAVSAKEVPFGGHDDEK